MPYFRSTDNQGDFGAFAPAFQSGINERIEKKWLYKKVSPKERLKIGIEIGTIGTVMELIDNNTAFVEFYDQNGEFVEIDNELAFKVELKNIKLKR
ncbi:MAG: hypothetical protein AAFU74_16080 [Bacteroidota bacterium]